MANAMTAPAGTSVLLQGNEAIARGALEANLAWASGYPGNPSSEILESLTRVPEKVRPYLEWSTNEKVALEGAAAASLAGLRAMVTMKQNGVNVCLDSLTTLALSGIKGGLVLVSADDPSSISSSNEEDSRFAAALAHIPLLEPATPQEALEMMRFAFYLSESIGNIVMVRSVSRLSHTRANVVVGGLPEAGPKPYFDTTKTYDTFPVVGKHQAMYDKLESARYLFETSPFNYYQGPPEAKTLIVASGPCFLFSREALELTGLEDSVGLLKIGTTYPLPWHYIRPYLAAAEDILVVEEIDPHLEKNIKVLAAESGPEIGVKNFYGKFSGHIPKVGEVTPGKTAQAVASITGVQYTPVKDSYGQEAAKLVEALIPAREYGFCPGCPHRASFWSIKNALAKDGRQGFVSGDIGCYTMGVWPTGFSQVKSVHSMGSGVGLASGYGKLKSRGFTQPVISVVGDSTFFHAAVPALINAAYNESGFLLVVLDNAATAMTGFQPHPGTGRSVLGDDLKKIDIEKVCASLGIEVKTVDPYDLHGTEEVLLSGLKDLREVKVIILKRTCALVQGRGEGFKYRMFIDQDLCRGESCGCNRYCKPGVPLSRFGLGP